MFNVLEKNMIPVWRLFQGSAIASFENGDILSFDFDSVDCVSLIYECERVFRARIETPRGAKLRFLDGF